MEKIRLKSPVLVVKDQRFVEHLEKMPHLESYRRIQAAYSIFENPSIAGKWVAIPPRLASREELTWVHTPEHISRIAADNDNPFILHVVITQIYVFRYPTILSLPHMQNQTC